MTTVLWLSEQYPAALVSFCGTVLWWAIAAHVYHKRVSFITDYRNDTQSSCNGSWSFDKLKDFTAKEELELQELYKTTTLLPRSPNLKKLDPLCISIIEQSFK